MTIVMLCTAELSKMHKFTIFYVRNVSFHYKKANIE